MLYCGGTYSEAKKMLKSLSLADLSLNDVAPNDLAYNF